MLSTEQGKAAALFEFYDSLMGVPAQRTMSINLDILGLPWLDLSSLADRFTEDEVLSVIRALQPDKEPGPDKFTGHFLQSTWEIIRGDLMVAFDAFWYLDTCNFHALNEALMVLLLKSADVVAIKDFRLMSLIHVLGKLFPSFWPIISCQDSGN
jgi:hypothetical protein